MSRSKSKRREPSAESSHSLIITVHAQGHGEPITAVRRVHARDDALTSLIKKAIADKTCADAVEPKWALAAIARCPVKFVAVEKNKKQASGFLMARFKKDVLYIELVCSSRKGIGSILLKEAIHLADSHDVNVELSSLPSVMPVYAKHKFKLRRSCSAKSVSLPRNLPRYATDDDAMEDPKMMKFMIGLADRGLTSNKRCAYKNLAKNKDGGKHDFYQNACEENGFHMLRCRDDL